MLGERAAGDPVEGARIMLQGGAGGRVRQPELVRRRYLAARPRGKGLVACRIFPSFGSCQAQLIWWKDASRDRRFSGFEAEAQGCTCEHRSSRHHESSMQPDFSVRIAASGIVRRSIPTASICRRLVPRCGCTFPNASDSQSRARCWLALQVRPGGLTPKLPDARLARSWPSRRIVAHRLRFDHAALRQMVATFR